MPQHMPTACIATPFLTLHLALPRSTSHPQKEFEDASEEPLKNKKPHIREMVAHRPADLFASVLTLCMLCTHVARRRLPCEAAGGPHVVHPICRLLNSHSMSRSSLPSCPSTSSACPRCQTHLTAATSTRHSTTTTSRAHRPAMLSNTGWPVPWTRPTTTVEA